jgi:ribosomal protein S27AE
LAELEAAVEAHVAHLRAQLLQEEIGSGFWEEQPLCRDCGASMERRTRATRTLLLPHEEPLRLERDYLVCPQCGAGLFSPG